MELEIRPEPAEGERAAVVVALERLGALAVQPASPWGRLDLELHDDGWDHSAPWRPAGGRGAPRA